ncbi:MAG: helix-turn-helix domain-containing protein, partial [Planctomycetota bacterium]
MDKETFGGYVRDLRIKKELTLRLAAEKIDIASPYLSRIEAGIEKPPSQEVIERMAKAYEVDPKTLIEKATNRAKEVYGDLVVNNPALNALFKVVRDLPDEKIEEIIRETCKNQGIDPQVLINEIKKRKMNLPRLRKVSEGLFAAD